jgi:hypothetical protein
MVKGASLFSQLLSEFPRYEFELLVKKHGAEKGAKGFSSWTQFVAMLFCQVAKADSLRVICNGLSCCAGKLVHLGVRNAPKRSTLSYANSHRTSALYEELFWKALDRFRAKDGGIGWRKPKFRFKNKLLSMDTTVISLCLSLFPWAEFQKTKGAVKAHLVMDHGDYMPSCLTITDGKESDVAVARTMVFNPGSIVVVDRGYNDYGLFARWTERGVWFVTRQTDNAVFEVVEERAVPQGRRIIADHLIRLTGVRAESRCPHVLRRIVVWDEQKARQLVFLTNHLSFGATTIASIYKDRWEIEVFFKALKQNLKVKTFVGTTENALLIQIWTALIAMLLLKWLHHISKAGWSLCNLVSMLRMNLFTYRCLFEWIHKPFDTPPEVPIAQQLSFAFAQIGQPIASRKG